MNARDLIEAIEQAISEAGEQVRRSQSNYARATDVCNDAYHELERADVNEDNAYDFVLKARELLRARRDAKGEYTINCKVLEAAKASLKDVKAALNHAESTHRRITSGE